MSREERERKLFGPPKPVKCPNCGSEIPREYRACPSCGFDVLAWREREAMRSDPGSRQLLFALAFVAAVVGLAGLGFGSASPAGPVAVVILLGLQVASFVGLPQYRWRGPWKSVWTSWPNFLVFNAIGVLIAWIIAFTMLNPGDFGYADGYAGSTAFCVFLYWAFTTHGRNHLPLP